MRRAWLHVVHCDTGCEHGGDTSSRQRRHSSNLNLCPAGSSPPREYRIMPAPSDNEAYAGHEVHSVSFRPVRAHTARDMCRYITRKNLTVVNCRMELYSAQRQTDWVLGSHPHEDDPFALLSHISHSLESLFFRAQMNHVAQQVAFNAFCGTTFASVHTLWVDAAYMPFDGDDARSFGLTIDLKASEFPCLMQDGTLVVDFCGRGDICVISHAAYTTDIHHIEQLVVGGTGRCNTIGDFMLVCALRPVIICDPTWAYMCVSPVVHAWDTIESTDESYARGRGGLFRGVHRKGLIRTVVPTVYTLFMARLRRMWA